MCDITRRLICEVMGCDEIFGKSRVEKRPLAKNELFVAILA